MKFIVDRLVAQDVVKIDDIHHFLCITEYLNFFYYFYSGQFYRMDENSTIMLLILHIPLNALHFKSFIKVSW